MIKSFLVCLGILQLQMRLSADTKCGVLGLPRKGEEREYSAHGRGHLLPVATRTCKQIALLLNISCLRTIISER